MLLLCGPIRYLAAMSVALNALALVGKILGIVAKPGWEVLEQNEKVIRLRREFDLGGDFPKSTFGSVFAFAMLEYAETASAAAIGLFKDRDVQRMFRASFTEGDLAGLHKELAGFVRRKKVGDALLASGGDAQAELERFHGLMCKWADQSRTPAEARNAQQLRRVEGKLDEVKAAMMPPAPPAWDLDRELRSWFSALGHSFEAYEQREQNAFQWLINVRSHRSYVRILVRGVRGEIMPADVQTARDAMVRQRAQEAWLVTDRRISQRALEDSKAATNVFCYTLDGLIEQDANWEPYLDWLEQEVLRVRLPELYVPIGCAKDDRQGRGELLARSHYGEKAGYTEGYLDRWLVDPAKEHISILGEFGTGKTWVALHYAWVLLRRYREAQRLGTTRPRIPVVISLRDFARVVDVETLFSDFFFRKHQMHLPSYAAFEQLNRMGKLLLIFDGFDEMAARIDRQKMIDHFWQMAKTVVTGSKVILTCRTEHFPDAIEGRKLLGAELMASTAKLTGEPPQFEVLELEKLGKEQIHQILEKRGASEAAITRILSHQDLADLATRPVMADLLLEALPDIEANRPVDLARVYLYAITRKVERDIKDERTFTSTADKFYFLTELCWEMWVNDQLNINYRQFPDRIRRLFGRLVNEQKELDHWHYDMMGQTLLVRNADGDYSPAHQSFVEFFVAYKVGATLGLLADEFIEPVRFPSRIDRRLNPIDLDWSDYFRACYLSNAQAQTPAPLGRFVTDSDEQLEQVLGTKMLTLPTIKLLSTMLTSKEHKRQLLHILTTYPQYRTSHLEANIATILISIDSSALGQADLTGSNLRSATLSHANLSNSELRDCDFRDAAMQGVVAVDADFSNSSFTGSILFDNNSYIQFALDASTYAVSYFLPRAIHWYPDDPDNYIRVAINKNGRGLYIFKEEELLWHISMDKSITEFEFDSRSRVLAVVTNQPYAIQFINVDTGMIMSNCADHPIYRWKNANFASVQGIAERDKELLRLLGAVNVT